MDNKYLKHCSVVLAFACLALPQVSHAQEIVHPQYQFQAVTFLPEYYDGKRLAHDGHNMVNQGRQDVDWGYIKKGESEIRRGETKIAQGNQMMADAQASGPVVNEYTTGPVIVYHEPEYVVHGPVFYHPWRHYRW